MMEHLGSLEVVKVNAAALERAGCSTSSSSKSKYHGNILKAYGLMLVMRDSKTGLEKRVLQHCPTLLDIDGVTTFKMQRRSLQSPEYYLEQLFSDLQTDHQWCPDQVNLFHNLSFYQVMYLKEVCQILNIPASNPQRGFVSHRWLSAYDSSMATYAMLPAYKVLYFGFLSSEEKDLYKEPLESIYTKYTVNPTARARIRTLHEDLNRKGEFYFKN